MRDLRVRGVVGGGGWAAEVDGGGPADGEERDEPGAHQLRNVPRQDAGARRLPATKPGPFSDGFASPSLPDLSAYLI